MLKIRDLETADGKRTLLLISQLFPIAVEAVSLSSHFACLPGRPDLCAAMPERVSSEQQSGACVGD